MGGRFGKYGDSKRKAGIRSSKPLRKNVSKIKPDQRRLRRPLKKNLTARKPRIKECLK
jgi:hypothetical protein